MGGGWYETPPSRIPSEGGVGSGVSTKETPPPSRNSSEEGVEGVLTKETPLRLTIRAREGWRVCWQKKPAYTAIFLYHVSQISHYGQCITCPDFRQEYFPTQNYFYTNFSLYCTPAPLPVVLII